MAERPAATKTMRLGRVETAIDGDHLPRDPRRIGRCKRHDPAGDVIRHAAPPQWNACALLCLDGLDLFVRELHALGQEVGLRGACRDGVYAYAVGREFERPA